MQPPFDSLPSPSPYINLGFHQNTIEIVIRGVNQKVELLHMFPFTSARKRSTVIVRDPLGRLITLCKGADSVIIPRLSASEREGHVLAATMVSARPCAVHVPCCRLPLKH